jgi:AraC-like DNA-binding protein
VPQSLPEIIRSKLLPISQHNAAQRFIIAPFPNAAQLPLDAQITPREIRGKRMVVKNRRYYGNTRGVIALWPEAGLNEVNKHKLACVLSGHIDYQLGDHRLRCGAGHFIFIPPGTPHPDSSLSYVDTQKSASCELLFFLLHPNALQCWISRSQPNERRRQEGNFLVLHERVAQLFRIMMAEVLEGNSPANAVGEQLLAAFLAVLLREAEAGHYRPVGGSTPHALHDVPSHLSPHASFPLRLEQHIQSNLHQPLTVRDVSREMFLSRAQFDRTVRRETGKSFNKLLTEHRLREAKKLLRDSQWTASAIAAFVGFKSVSYFRTFFRKHTGSTPSEFRRRQNKTNLQK